MKIFYLTRTDPDENSGGAVIRRGSIHFMRDYGYEVWVVMPAKINQDCYIDEDRKRILINRYDNKVLDKLLILGESVGLLDDYLQPWANKAYKILKNKSIIHAEDIVFATSGGELGMLILGRKLARDTGCKFIINLHDPIAFTTMDKRTLSYRSKRTEWMHVKRDKQEACLFHSSAMVITSSMFYQKNLQAKYPALQSKIFCNHFGYIEKEANVNTKEFNRDSIVITYGGAVGSLQSLQILPEATKFSENIKACIVCDKSKHSQFQSISENVGLYDMMPHDKYLNFLKEETDIGFLSLVGELSDVCVPSKLYEYINVGLPILAIVGGDAKKIIEERRYGVVADYSVGSLNAALEKLCQPAFYNECKRNILMDREEWYMGNKVKELLDMIINDKSECL